MRIIKVGDFKIGRDEKKAINAKLIPLYNKVGKIQEAMRLEGK